MTVRQSCVFVCTVDDELVRAIQQEAILRLPHIAMHSAKNLKRLHAELRQRLPIAIVLSGAVLAGGKMDEQVQKLETLSPTIVVGTAQDHVNVARLVTAGRIRFVALQPGAPVLIVALLECIVRATAAATAPVEMASRDLPEELLEFLRHEINNPLTGILGNAELVLAARDRLSPASVRRLRTVVELAVRLRDNVLRITNGRKCARGAT
jgi:signal transduction histidine kinase